MHPLDNNAARLSPLERIYTALSPCVFAASLGFAYLTGASAGELRERMGRLPPAAAGSIWLHGASAGEMAGAVRLVAALRRQGWCSTAIFTAANRAGVAYAARCAQPGTVAALAPWDVRRWLGRAFDSWRPSALFLIETELWPLLVFEAHRRNIPVLSLSARIYPTDVPRYHAIRNFMLPTLHRLARILAQNETERDRFIALGAAAETVVAAGNLKHLEQRRPADRVRLRRLIGLGADEELVVFGSMHRREMPLVSQAIAAVAAHNTRFVVAPRHLSSLADVLRLSAALNLPFQLRSKLQPEVNWRILVLDTMGELSDFYALASIAVVGGGFARHGGHNLLEAVQAGAPVLFGVHCDHFEHEARVLAAATPQAVVDGPQALAQRLREWLQDDARRRQILSRQRLTLPDTAAITRRYLDELSPYLAPRHA